MLILTRRKGEEIVINENIIVAVTEINGDKIKIGISAPRDTPVHRREVYEKIKKKREEHEET